MQWSPVARLVGFAALSTSIVVAGITSHGSKRLLNWVLESGIMRFLGRISYGLYLYHVPILIGFHKSESGNELLSGPAERVLVPLLLSLLLATVSYYGLEARVLRLAPQHTRTTSGAQ